LDLAALRELTAQAAREMESAVDPDWLWHGLHAKLIDGFTFTLLDTPNNQRAFPQSKKQRPGAGFPLARACAILSLATGLARDVQPLWRQARERIAANEVANRPGRIEPRVIKRTRHRYPLLHESRQELPRRLHVT
jgi:hypothetical protein